MPLWFLIQLGVDFTKPFAPSKWHSKKCHSNLPTIEQLNSSFNINQFRVQNIKSHLPFAKFNFPEKAFLLCKRWWNLDFLQISLLEGFANDTHSTFWRSSLLLLLQKVLLSFALKMRSALALMLINSQMPWSSFLMNNGKLCEAKVWPHKCHNYQTGLHLVSISSMFYVQLLCL